MPTPALTETASYYAVISQLPPDTTVTFHSVSWDEYEELLNQTGEPAGLRISYDQGTLNVMTVSATHEKYTRFIETLMTAIRLRLRIKILGFGSATMRKSSKSVGKEPDACFYVQTADALGARMDLDFAVDPPPDVAVEIDIHHGSLDKFPIYVSLGVPELWLYDGSALTIYQLEHDQYVTRESSPALPMLSAALLTEYLNRLQTEDEFQVLLAFDEWLTKLATQ
jgi:Uma2 family endonuclease